MWFLQIMRTFFFTIDSAIFNLIPFMYDLLIKISRTSILSQGQIQSFAGRVQMLLGVFMLFKVSFSLITYLVNPDEFNDKSKGFAKLWQNVIISLIMLVLVPYAFNMAYELQAMILEDNALASLIFGSDQKDDNYLNTAGDTMAYTVMIPFFSPYLSASYNSDSGSQVLDLTSCSILTNDDGTFNEECAKAMYSAVGDDNNVDIKNYVAGVEKQNLGLTFRLNLAKLSVANSKDTLIIDYKIPLSTIVGVIVCLLLVIFCLDVALRSLKLSFLQLISPIPIISFIDPKSGKDGLFKKWYQMCFSTYLSLFVRLLALYLGVYIISKVSVMHDVINGSLISDPLVKVFIIIGVLMFIKQLPKILEGLGIKLDSGGGKFTLNPFKKIEDEALGGKRLLGAAGGLAAGTVDRATRLVTAPGLKNKAAAFNPLGIAGDAIRGFSGNKGFSGGMKNQANVNRRLRESRIKGLSPTAAYMDYFGAKFGLDNAGIEREATRNEWNKKQAKLVEKNIAQKKMENDIEIDKLKKGGEVRKKTQASHENVGKQVGKLFDTVDDFITKKGDFDTGNQLRLSDLKEKMESSKIAYINSVKHKAKTLGLDPDKISVLGHNGKNVNINNITDDDVIFTDANGNSMFRDEFYLREKRKINEKNYKLNRQDDSNNYNVLKKSLENNNPLATSMLIGNEYFEKGQIVSDDDVRRAENSMNKYIVDSQKGATNDFNTIVTMDEIVGKRNNGVQLTQSEIDYYNHNIGFYNEINSNGFVNNFRDDINTFNNIKMELTQSVEQTKDLISKYNTKYNNENNLDDITYDPSSPRFYETIKAIKGSMKSGTNVTQMNLEDSKLQSKIDDLEAKNNSLYAEATTKYWFENGKRDDVSLDYSNKHTKAKDEEINDYKNMHKELANIHESMGGNK